MKKVFILIAVFVISAGIVSASENASEQGKLKVDTKASKVYWTGKKVTGEHTGYVTVEDGTLMMKDGKLSSATINMNMNSIVCTDLEGEWNGKLVGHLKSDDFFSVEKHPIAKFEAKSFKKTGMKHEVTGDLTIKGITHEVSFPVDVKMDGDKVMANGTAKFDRTKWDIRYRSGKFFSDLGDNLIYDEFEIKFELVATASEEYTSL